MKSFDNKMFNEYSAGDFILAEWSNLVIGKYTTTKILVLHLYNITFYNCK